MARVASRITGSAALAEDAVQETWLAVLKGLHAFQGRSSLRTWVFRILVKRARTLRARERRMIPVSQLRTENEDDPFSGRFELPESPGQWTVMPLREWGRDPERDVLSGEVREVIHRAIARLAPAQREVLTLRDVEGWGAAEVCNVLDVSEVHQRVLLHRARARVRAALEAYDLGNSGDRSRPAVPGAGGLGGRLPAGAAARAPAIRAAWLRRAMSGAVRR